MPHACFHKLCQGPLLCIIIFQNERISKEKFDRKLFDKLNKLSINKDERKEGTHFFCLLSLYSFRVTLKASCPMDLRLYPMDVQHCPLIIESCKMNSLYFMYRVR